MIVIKLDECVVSPSTGAILFEEGQEIGPDEAGEAKALLTAHMKGVFGMEKFASVLAGEAYYNCFVLEVMLRELTNAYKKAELFRAMFEDAAKEER